VKQLSSNMKSHIEGEVTSLATCWSLTRQDGVALSFTDFDNDLTVDGNIYRAETGYSRTAIENTSGLTVDNLDIIGSLDSAAITEQDLMAGLYDFAEVTIFMVNWQDLSMGRIPLRTGWLGEISFEDGRFTAELRGLGQALLSEIGEVYTPTCRVDLGSSACGIDLSPLQETDVIASVTNRSQFSLTSYDGADEVLAGGAMTVTSGLNSGRSIEMRTWSQSTKTVTLLFELPYDLTIGDTVSFYPGCDKRFVTCRDVFGNQINFRGFPHIPGTDALLESGNG
jgi:uncharacterized phage protein (TIGR02218 family)